MFGAPCIEVSDERVELGVVNLGQGPQDNAQTRCKRTGGHPGQVIHTPRMCLIETLSRPCG